MKNQIHLLKTKRFLPLFVAQFFGAFNDNVFKNAFLIWFTYDIAQKLGMSAQIMVTIASGLFILPFFLFSALAGQLADKYEKSKLVQIIKIAEILIMSLSFVGFYFENINLLLALIFLMGAHSAFFGPLKYSLLPQHLKSDELVGGNAMIEGGTFLAILLGTIVGGIVIRLTDGLVTISVAVVLFAVIGWLGSCFILRSPASDPRLKISFNIAAQSLKIINYAREKKIVWLAIIGISWFWFIGASFLSQFPIYTKNIINGNEYIVTFFLAIFSIGIAVGSVLCNKLLKGKIDGRLVPLGLMGISIGIIIFCGASYFYNSPALPENLIGLQEFLFANIQSWFIVLGLLMIAVFAGIYIVPLYAIMQYHCEKKYLSRIVAANNFMNAVFMVGSSLGLLVLFKMGLGLLWVFFGVGVVNLGMVVVLRGVVGDDVYRKANK